MPFIKHFMLIMGSVSSVFDLLTFYVLLSYFKADAALFQTAWFMESMCTQVLAIFVLRTPKAPFKGVPHPYLLVSCIAVIAVAWGLPQTVVGGMFGFVKPPASLYPILAGLVISYLMILGFSKKYFYLFFLSDG